MISVADFIAGGQLGAEIRSEWDDLKEHDVVFFLTVRPPLAHEKAAMGEQGDNVPFPQRYGVVSVRGAEARPLQPTSVR